MKTVLLLVILGWLASPTSASGLQIETGQQDAADPASAPALRDLQPIIDAVQGRRWTAARQLLKDQLADSPYDSKVDYLLADLCMKLNRLEDARQILDQLSSQPVDS